MKQDQQTSAGDGLPASMDFAQPCTLKRGLQRYHATPGAILVDVRSREEYRQGHLPGSIHVPLNTLEDDIYEVAPETDTPIFLYCASGNRSAQAETALKELGYENAVSIGGLNGYSGDLTKEE